MASNYKKLYAAINLELLAHPPSKVLTVVFFWGRTVLPAGPTLLLKTRADSRSQSQFITNPPSTSKFCPVMPRANGLSSMTTASAISSGVVT